MTEITGREFVGFILPDKDPKRQGRYKVYIPELMPNLPRNVGIWCKNHVHCYRITTSKNGIYGQYFPLQPNTKVIVKFFHNDFNSGYIERIVSDSEVDTQLQPPECESSTENRDDIYILIRTPKYDNIIYVNEDTIDKSNSIHIHYNYNKDKKRGRTYIKIDENGIYFETDDNVEGIVHKNVNIHVDGNASIDIDKNANIRVGKDANIEVDGNIDIDANSNVTIDVDGNTDIQVGRDASIRVDGNTNISGDNIDIISDNDIKLTASGNNIDITSSGSTNVKASNVNIDSSEHVEINSSNIDINANGTINMKSSSEVIIDAPSVIIDNLVTS